MGEGEWCQFAAVCQCCVVVAALPAASGLHLDSRHCGNFLASLVMHVGVRPRPSVCVGVTALSFLLTGWIDPLCPHWLLASFPPETSCFSFLPLSHRWFGFGFDPHAQVSSFLSFVSVILLNSIPKVVRVAVRPSVRPSCGGNDRRLSLLSNVSFSGLRSMNCTSPPPFFCRFFFLFSFS